MPVTLVNRTPHDPLVLWIGETAVASLPAQHPTARCAEEATEAGVLDVAGQGIRLLALGFGDVQDLPEPEPGVVHIVSRIVVEALPDRHDLVHPAELVRDDAGTILGCRALARPAGLGGVTA